MAHLPTCDFLLFRHTARVQNTSATFAAIDADYRNAYKQALDLVDHTGGSKSGATEESNELSLDTVVAHLAHVTRDATSTAPLMVALRATQSALLTRGWLLGAHQDKAIGTMCAIRSPNPTEAHWRSLHGYVRTARCAGVALYLLDVPPDDLNNITVGEVKAFLASGHIGTQPIPDLAKPLLRAHLNLRYDQDALPSDPYLNQKGPRRHLEDLIDARRHLGIPIDARFLRGGTLKHTERPIWRFGLELRSLT